MARMSVFRGDDDSWSLLHKDSDGNAISLVGATIFFTVKKNKTDADADALISKDITVHVDAANGESSLVLSDTDTDIEVGDHYFDVQIKDSTGTIDTYGSGVFRVKQDITTRTS